MKKRSILFLVHFSFKLFYKKFFLMDLIFILFIFPRILPSLLLCNNILILILCNKSSKLSVDL